MNAKNPQHLLDKKELSNELQISIRTIDMLRKTGELRNVDVEGLVRFDPEDIRKFINSKKIRERRHQLGKKKK